MNQLRKLLQSRLASLARRSVRSEPSAYLLAKAQRHILVNLKRNARDTMLIGAGILSASFGFKGFLLTNKFIDGGATGISLLASTLWNIPLWTCIVLINIPFIWLAYRIIGSRFAIKTLLAIAGLAICLGTLSFPNVTDDNLLVAVFGGFFLGAGIGLAVRGGAVIDGTEVLAIHLSRKLGTTMGDIVLMINILIFSTAAWLLGVEVALYSMVTYLAASKTLDFVVEGIEEYTGVTIISPRSEDIRLMILQTMGRGLTVYRGQRGLGIPEERKDIDILYTVLTRLELNRLHTELEKIDPNAFVVMTPVKDTRGGMIKKRAHVHSE